MSFTNITTNYISSAKYAAVTAWVANTAKTVGQLVRQSATPSVGNERVFVCIVAGTTHATTEPTWSVSRGDKTTDGTVTWQEVTGLPGLNGDFTSTPTWLTGAKSTNVSQGHVITDNAGTHLFIASVANNNAGSGAEPSWNLGAVGNTTTDNSVTWTYLGTSFGAWAAPHARFQNSLGSGWGTGSPVDPTRFYLGSDSAETQTGSINTTNRGALTTPIDLMCVNVAGSLPPVSADLRTTGAISSDSSITLNGYFRVIHGVKFTAGTSGNVTLGTGTDGADVNFESCTFSFGVGAGSSSGFQWAQARTILRGCTFKFTNVGQTIKSGGQVRYIDCSVDGAGSIPTTLISENVNGCDWSFEGCDLSALSGTVLGSNGRNTNSFGFYDCNFPASFTPWSFTGSNATGEKVTFSRCSSGGLPLQFVYIERAGTLTASQTIYRTGGASENGVAFSWGILTNTATSIGSSIFEVPPMAKNNPNTGVNVTVTMYGIVNAAALPKTDELAMDVHYLGASGNTKASIKTSRVADFLASGANYTADSTSAWDAGATARANSTAYSVGDIRSVSSNSGRLFFCTTAGTSSGSLPGGYASAVDGGSVTDGTAVFRAGVRFSMAVTLTSPQPQLAGMLFSKLAIFKKSTTFYIDPTLTLT